MTIKTLLLILSVTPALTLATTPPPFAAERGLIDRIFAAASASETSDTALKLLEYVARGHTGEIQDGLEGKVGLAQSQLRTKWFSDPTVRAYALLKIGQTGLPAALEFLTGLTRDDFRVDSSGRLWADAQVALANAVLLGIQDAQSQTEFLVHTMKTSLAASWAGEQLCDRGALSALPDVRQWLRSRRNGPRDEDDIEFCEARMRTVARDPDRAKALGTAFSSFVSSANSFRERRLLSWAIGELAAMKSPEADAELDRVRDEIGVALKGDRSDSNLLGIQAEIHAARMAQGK